MFGPCSLFPFLFLLALIFRLTSGYSSCRFARGLLPADTGRSIQLDDFAHERLVLPPLLRSV